MDTERTDQITRLYEDHSERLIATVRRSVRQLADADIEDACAFAWATLVRREDIDLTDRARVHGWLFTVARNEAYRISGQRRDRPTYDPQDTAEPTSHADVLKDILDRETLRSVGLLPPRQQQVIRLRAEGLSRQEIADTLGWTLLTVDRQTYRALARLRKMKE